MKNSISRVEKKSEPTNLTTVKADHNLFIGLYTKSLLFSNFSIQILGNKFIEIFYIMFLNRLIFGWLPLGLFRTPKL
jgi:hypothetical protein